MKINPTFKSEYSSRKVPSVRRVERIVKVRTATEKFKENDYVEMNRESTDEAKSVSEQTVNHDRKSTLTADEIFEMMQAQAMAKRSKILNNIKNTPTEETTDQVRKR